MASVGWQWPVTMSALRHEERVSFMRQIPYERTRVLEEERPDVGMEKSGHALSINISSGGMLLLMRGKAAVGQAMRIQVPASSNLAEVPTLAEVRWVRKVPFPTHDDLSFVGVSFILARG